MKKDVYKYNQVGQSFNVKEKIYERNELNGLKG